MRDAYLTTFFLVVLAVGVLGFRGCVSTRPPLEVFPDMDRQPKYRPQGASAFFADGRADRPLPQGVVARGQLRADPAFFEGRGAGGAWIKGMPAAVTVDARFLERGRERYTIYCAPCHGALGDGAGITRAYGMGATPTYHDPRLRTMAEGELYNTITNGKATMMPYADKIEPADRWAVVAYVRALQRAQTGSVADVPAHHKSELGLP
jgi:mono/diheme cytochrome c family protein